MFMVGGCTVGLFLLMNRVISATLNLFEGKLLVFSVLK